MSDLLNTLDKIELLQDQSVFLHIDKNNIPGIVLKDSNITDISKARLYYYSTNTTFYLIVKNSNTIYTTTIDISKISDNIIDFFNTHCFINIALFSSSANIHPINKTAMKALIVNKTLLNIKDKNELNSYIAKMEVV